MLKDFFARTYVINLNWRTDRLREIQRELSRFGATLGREGFSRFEAVRPDAANGFPTIGARGCFLSHLGVFRDALKTAPGEPILILEDDVSFSANFDRRAPRLLKQLMTQDWSLFYGGYDVLKLDGQEIIQLDPKDYLQQSHFIAFNAKAVSDAANYLETLLTRPPGHPDGGPMHVDGAYNWFRRVYPEHKTFAANPPLAYQRRSRTDVGALQWYDRATVLRTAISQARWVMNTALKPEGRLERSGKAAK